MTNNLKDKKEYEEAIENNLKEDITPDLTSKDMFQSFAKLLLFFTIVVLFGAILTESIKNESIIRLYPSHSGIQLSFILIPLIVISFLIYLDFKTNHTISRVLKVIFKTTIKLAIFCLFLFCFYSIIANIIHFNILDAILFTFGAIITLFIFWFILEL